MTMHLRARTIPRVEAYNVQAYTIECIDFSFRQIDTNRVVEY